MHPRQEAKPDDRSERLEKLNRRHRRRMDARRSAGGQPRRENKPGATRDGFSANPDVGGGRERTQGMQNERRSLQPATGFIAGVECVIRRRGRTPERRPVTHTRTRHVNKHGIPETIGSRGVYVHFTCARPHDVPLFMLDKGRGLRHRGDDLSPSSPAPPRTATEPMTQKNIAPRKHGRLLWFFHLDAASAAVHPLDQLCTQVKVERTPRRTLINRHSYIFNSLRLAGLYRV